MPGALLSIRNLQTHFHTDDGIVKAVDGVSFDLAPGSILGIVGESGSGKSVTQLSIMGLVPCPPGRISGDGAIFKGRDLLGMRKSELRRIRGNEISMIFQDPMTSLNPILRISRQLTEGMEVHLGLSGKDALDRAVDLLSLVGMPSPRKRIHSYPHQFSGGMRQRVMIAMALACDPDLLIADEPTTALDVTIQAQILELLKKIQADRGMSCILITHDLGVVAGMCDHIVVMYAGRIVEKAATKPLFERPLHPYTFSLLKSIPRMDAAKKEKLFTIPGLPPNLINNPPGCNFAPRCPFAFDRCEREDPALEEIDPGREIACWFDIENDRRR